MAASTGVIEQISQAVGGQLLATWNVYHEEAAKRKLGGAIPRVIAAANLVFAVVFHFFLGAYIVVESFNLRFEMAVRKSVTNVVMVIIVGVIFACIPIFWSSKPLLEWLKIYLRDLNKLAVTFLVDVTFEILGNMKIREGRSSILAASLYECGFVVVGFIVVLIHLNYHRDNTGITIGAIAAASKALSKFNQQQLNQTRPMEWATGVTLVVAGLYLYLTQASKPVEATAATSATAAATSATAAADAATAAQAAATAAQAAADAATATQAAAAAAAADAATAAQAAAAAATTAQAAAAAAQGGVAAAGAQGSGAGA